MYIPNYGKIWNTKLISLHRHLHNHLCDILFHVSHNLETFSTFFTLFSDANKRISHILHNTTVYMGIGNFVLIVIFVTNWRRWFFFESSTDKSNPPTNIFRKTKEKDYLQSELQFSTEITKQEQFNYE